MTISASKPAILIYGLGNVPKTLLEQVQFGIEEEGIPYLYKFHQVQEENNLVSLAYQAAQSSALSVGIAIDETEMIVHYRNLQENQFVYRLSEISHQKTAVLRILGGNAAKLVKGIPLIGHDALEVSF